MHAKPHMHTFAILGFVSLAAACSWPQHKASRLVTFEVPAAALQRLSCTTNNGDVKLVGSPTATSVTVRAELSVRGHTAEEAEANLQLLEVERAVDGDALRLIARFPERTLARCSPRFDFTIDLPARLATESLSHNGDIVVQGVAGAAKATTHNGSIALAGDSPDVQATSHNGDVSWRGSGRRVALTTHNGDVDAEFAASGEVQADLSSHNGDVTLGLPGAVDALFAAETSNGDVRLRASGTDAVVVGRGRRTATGRLGKGGNGQIRATTHNGDVVVK